MILEDIRAKIDEIYLDPYNPRFVNQMNEDQEAVLEKILKSKASTELMNSMKVDIKWVNKIVVISKDNFSTQQNSIKGITGCNYLVVEGNNRLACLKSGNISGVDSQTEIPVLLAKKSPNETQSEFEAQLRVTQGIANVMVVKEWSVISKSRHLFGMYNDFKRRDEQDSKTTHEYYKKIADELGIGTSEVRQSVIRYDFYKRINSVADYIPDDHWGYLEAFDRTKEIRAKFGMSADTNSFNEDEEVEDYMEEIYKDIPVVIKKAAHEGINTKQFRDVMGILLNDIRETEELYEFIRNIVSKESDFSFRQEMDQNKQITDKEKWEKDLQNIKEKLGLFPSFATWSAEFKKELVDIKNKIEKLINSIEM